jgi:hypothetical protein
VDDIQRLRNALGTVEQEAKALPWANDRGWRAASHVWIEHGAPTIDLHDLNVKLANQAVDAVIDVAPSCDSGGFVFVTGRGRHSLGGRSDLSDSVASTLDRHARAAGWAWHPSRAGRLVLVTDARRAPAIATGALPLPIVVGAIAFLLLALYFAPPAGIALSVLAILGWFVSRRPNTPEDRDPGT